MSLFWSVSILAVLHLTSRGNGEDCPLRILGQQKTVFKAPVGAHLQISCTIQNNCSKEFEKVSWYRLESYNLVPVTNDSGVITILEHISNLENTLLLRFTNIQKRDAGLYRCQGGLAVGHPINVSVHDNPTTINSSSRNETSSAGEAQWILVYSALGTVAFVFTVISLSVLSMRKGHPKRRTQMENQGISMENQHIGVKLLTRQTASDSPTMKETPPSPLPRDGSYICSQPSKGKEDNPNKRMEEEESGIVYAALNHQLPPGGAARPWRPKEERSEYAAILV